MTPDRTPYCHKIRYGITGAPILTEDDMDGSHAPGVGVEPRLIELVYSTARDGKPASVSASVTGWWTRFGRRDEPDDQMTTHFKSGPNGWPEWLAEEARLHDPDAAAASAGPAPADWAATIADVIGPIMLVGLQDAELVGEPGAERIRDWGKWISETVAALPSELRRMADETPQQPETAAPLQVWPLTRVLTEVRCGSQDWTWDEEWADLDRRHAETGYLDKLGRDIRANGITMPVLIGTDGRLRDGHHRLRLAVRLGIGYVPVELTAPAAVAQPDEEAKPRQPCACGQDGCEYCDVDEEA